MEQTVFDYPFYNSQHLYGEQTKANLMKMIDTAIVIYESPGAIRRIVEDQFLSSADEVMYAMNLFMNWCLNKTFVTFEAFPREIPYLSDSLKEFFVDSNYDEMRVKIFNVLKLMPNVQCWRDCKNRVHNLKGFIQNSPDRLGQSVESQNIQKILPHSLKHEVVLHVVDALEQIGFDFMGHRESRLKMQKMAIKMKLQKLDFDGVIRADNLRTFMSKLDGAGIDIDELNAEHLLKQIRENMDRQDNNYGELVLEYLKPKYYPMIYDGNDQKKIFADYFGSALELFHGPISKLTKATKRDFEDVIKAINRKYSHRLFNVDDSNELCRYLFKKLFHDLEHLKPWSCDRCHFSNRKMMVGGLWRLYNQLRRNLFLRASAMMSVSLGSSGLFFS